MLWVACVSAPPPAQNCVNPSSVRAEQTVRVRLNCESMCSHIESSCRQACRPQAWSPNMQSIQDSCEHDCDFQRFTCVHDCQGS